MAVQIISGLTSTTLNGSANSAVIIPALGDDVFVDESGDVIAAGDNAHGIFGNNTGNHHVEVHGQVFSSLGDGINLGQSGTTAPNQVIVGRSGSVTSADEDGITVNGASNLVVVHGSVYGFGGGIDSTGDDQRVQVASTGSVTSYTGRGIDFSGGGGHVVDNAGLVSSAFFDAISLAGVNANTLNNSGTIIAEEDGVRLMNGRNTLTNSGSITGGAYNAVEFGASLGGYNHLLNTGTITARDYNGTASPTACGVNAIEGGNVIVNHGAIISDYFGVGLGVGITANNVNNDTVTNTGSITGSTGVKVDTSGLSLVNSGEISANGTSSVIFDGDAINVTANAATIVNDGILNATSSGIETGASGAPTVDNTVTNNGTINAANGINDFSGGSLLVNNGVINAENTGIRSTGNFISATNNGSIAVEAQFGIHITGENAIVENTGDITANDSDGIYVNGPASQVMNSGTISAGDDGVFIDGDGASFVNAATGVIDAEQEGVQIGANLTGGNLLLNEGTITSRISDAVSFDGESNETVINRGTLAAKDASSVDRALEMTSATGDTALIVNEGTMSAFDTAMNLGGGNEYVINSGFIYGRVELGAGNDTFDGRGGFVSYNVAGGLGDDTYVVDATSSFLIVEGFGNGTDTVRADMDYVLGDGLENLTLIGVDTWSGAGNDEANIITGNFSDNALFGRGGNDTLNGGAGDDVLDGGAGADSIDGGAGVDTVTYENALGPVTASLINPAVNTAEAAGDTYANVENLTGSAFDDGLNADHNDNVLNGGAGDDNLKGLRGNDVLIGGEGADKFIFNSTLDAVTNVDNIADFEIGLDLIYVDDIIFTALSGGVLTAAAFRANTTGNAEDADDRIIYETDTGDLRYDADGNGAGASVLFATMAAGLALTEADFLVI